MRQIGVLQLRSSSGFFGAENVIFELAKELTRSDYKPFVGVFKNSRNPHIELGEITKSYKIETVFFQSDGQFDLRTLFAIKDFIDNNNIRIIHSHGYKTNIYALLVGWFKRIPVIVTCHPWIKTSPRMRLYARLDKMWLNRFDRIIAVSDEVQKEILNSRVVNSKVSIIDNGIDIDRFTDSFNIDNIRKDFNIKSNLKVVGTIGRLSEEKGHSLFLNAAKLVVERYSDIKFIIVGDGPLKRKLQESVLDLNLQNHVVFTGIRNDIPRILTLFDIFVLPSLTEGLPMVLLEAMAAKKPILVISWKIAVAELVEKLNVGIVVRPDNIQSIQSAILKLLKERGDQSYYKGKEKLIEKYSRRSRTSELAACFDELLRTSDFLES